MSTHDLFAAAREDGPSDTSHEEMWTRVAAATGVAAGVTSVTSAAGAASVKTVKAALSAKLLAIGGLIGAAGTALGVVVATTVVTPASSPADAPVRAQATRVVRTTAGGARLSESPPRRIDPAMYARAPEAPVVAPAPTASPASDLATEAGLITAARTALVRGDASRALVLVRATRQLPTRALVPESLSLEARALQALGRADEAAAVELALRKRYPDHALAR